MSYHLLWTVAGAVLVIALVVDAIVTTLLLSGAGFLSGPLARTIGRFCMKRRAAYIAENASVMALLATFVFWTLLLLTAWTMIFCGSAEAVLSSEEKIPADFLSRVYFTGFTITTLGTGNFIPNGPLWQLLSVAAAANGFFLVSICVTYIFSVLTALNERRAIGVTVGHLGKTPVDIVALATDPAGLASLSSRLQDLTHRIELASVKTESFPVVEYMHVHHQQYSFALAVAALGEIVSLFENAILEESAPPRAVLVPLKQAVNLLIDEMHSTKSENTPPLPRLDAHGSLLPLRTEWQSRLQATAVSDYRARLSAWLAWHHYEWTDLYRSAE